MKPISWARFFIEHLTRKREDVAASVAAHLADILLGTKKDPRRASSFSYRIFDWNDNEGYEYALVSAKCPGQAFGETWPLVTPGEDPRARIIDLLAACMATDYSISITSPERNLNLNDTVLDIECPPSDHLSTNKHLDSIFKVCENGSVGTTRKSLFAEAAPTPPRQRQFASPSFWICMGLLFLAGLILWGRNQFIIIDRIPTRARIAAASLEQALRSYQSEYGRLPSSAAPVMLSTGPEGTALLNALHGHANPGGENSRDINFLSIREGRANKDGLIYAPFAHSITGLYDPWGRPYHLYLDTTATGSVRLPSGETVPGKLAVIISDGPDGKPGTRDDIRSDQPAPNP